MKIAYLQESISQMIRINIKLPSVFTQSMGENRLCHIPAALGSVCGGFDVAVNPLLLRRGHPDLQ